MPRHTLVEGERKDKLKYVNVADILCEGRAREDLGDLDELKSSIKDKGVIQPITLTSGLKLLAGGRRYTACVELGIPTIPAVLRDSIDEVDEKEIELVENVHRKDFTWQERAKLVAYIDELYRRKDPVNWNQRKTAELVNLPLGSANRDLQLAKALQVIPELNTCENAHDATKLVKKFEERAIVQELRRRQDAKVNGTSPAGKGLDHGIKNALREANNNYIIGDTFAGMSKLKDNGHISIIECDPPYGVDLNKLKASSTGTGNADTYKEVDKSVYIEFLNKLTTELYRVAGRNCWLVFWFGNVWQQEVYNSLTNAGWKVDAVPAIWVKPTGQTQQPEMQYARCYEPFFLARKGKPIMAERGRSNVFAYSGASHKYHPTERPVTLIEEIFSTLSSGMDTVFVPFLGSGATLRACYNRGLQGFGYDLDGQYKDKFMLAVEEDTRRLFKE